MKAVLAAVLAASLAAGAAGAEHTINLINPEGPMRFDPEFLQIAPGDTVIFPGTLDHDSDSIRGGIPEGAESWNGTMDEDVRLTLTVEGLYAFKCTPHYSEGMVGLIQVGEGAPNAEAIAALKMSAKAKARMDELLARAAGN